MCSSPSMPSTPAAAAQEQPASPTAADASVTKAAASTRNKTAALAGRRDTKTSARGLSDGAISQKKSLLGE